MGCLVTERNQWFGKTPDGWQIKRNKEIFAEVSTPSKTGEETLLTVSHITGVTPRSEKNVNMFMAENMTGYKQCKPGDLIINTMWAWMGALGTSKYAGICSPAYGVYRPRRGVDYHAGYFDYLFRTPNAIMEMTRYSKGIVSSRLRLYPKDFYQIETCLPPFAEQKAIADYLDKQTSLLDRRIILLNNKIEKYQELKKALTNAVICRGLNPASKMIDSEILWLGSFPKHWHLKRVRDIAFLQSGVSIGADEFIDEGKYPVFGGNGLRGYTGNYTNDGNFVLIGRQGALCGNINYASGKFWATEHAVIVYQSKGINVFWLGELLRVMNLNQYSLSAAQPGLAVDKIKNLMIPVPSEKEQEEIAAYLDERTGRIDAIVAKLKEQVEKLQELRKTLIQDVVTGKIRVVDGVRA